MDMVRPGGQAGTEAGDRSADAADHGRAVRSWPLLVLAAPAAVAVWSGWVGIGRMTGFGQVHPLPGVWGSLHLNTAVTLPVGVEVYAAYALHAWLASSRYVSPRTRRFAKWSAIASLLLGMAGQVAYHLLSEAGARHAPWGITTAVSCLPVLVLGMGSAFAHMLRGDAQTAASNAPATDQASGHSADQAMVRPDRDVAGPDRSGPTDQRRPATGTDRPGGTGTADRSDEAKCSAVFGPPVGARPPGHEPRLARPGTTLRIAAARSAALQLESAGVRVSRSALRNVGLRGSNAELGALARLVNTERTGDASGDI